MIPKGSSLYYVSTFFVIFSDLQDPQTSLVINVYFLSVDFITSLTLLWLPRLPQCSRWSRTSIQRRCLMTLCKIDTFNNQRDSFIFGLDVLSIFFWKYPIQNDVTAYSIFTYIPSLKLCWFSDTKASYLFINTYMIYILTCPWQYAQAGLDLSNIDECDKCPT